MSTLPTAPSSDQEDPFDLTRFVRAQEDCYEQALSELRNGQKRTHWMWFVFPQLRGLGSSPTSKKYGITGADEARAYLAHDLLGPRLIAVCEAAKCITGRSATDIFGTPDDMKLRSCATLFAQVSNPDSVFHQVIEKYFDGQLDPRTVERLARG